MKTKLLKHFSLRATLLAAMVCAAVTGAWAEESTVTASKVASASESWTGSAGETWSVSVDGGATGQNVNNSYAQVGTKNSPSTSITFSTSGISGTVTSIVVDCAAYNGSATVSATVGGAAFGTQGQNVPSWSSNAGGEVTFSGSASGAITITMTNGSGGRAMYIKSIDVTYENSSDPTKTDTEVTIKSDIQNTDVYKSTEAGKLVANIFDAAENTVEGSVTWSSSDESVATIGETTGVVTLVAAGTVTFTATYAGDDTHNGSSATIDFTITDSTPAVDFEKVTSADDLAAGDELLLVYDGDHGKYAATTISSNLLGFTSVTINNDIIALKNSDDANVFVLGGKKDNWTLYSKGDEGYIYATAAKKLGKKDTDEAAWTITYENGDFELTSVTASYGSVQFNYNNGSARFLNYTSNQEAIQLYRKVVDRTALSVGAAGYTTYVTKKNVSFPSGVSAYIATSTADATVKLTKVLAAPANTAVIIEAAAGEYDLDEEAAADCDDVSKNLLLGSNGYVKGDASTIFALGKQNDTVGFYLVSDGAAVPAGKAYLKVTDGSVKDFMGFDFGGQTAVSSVKAQRVSGTIYNLAGQRVQTAQRGIFIVNGKKVVK